MFSFSINDVESNQKSSVTAKGYRHRTTIPKEIFKKLELEDKDELQWVLFKNGAVVVSKVKKNGTTKLGK